MRTPTILQGRFGRAHKGFVAGLGLAAVVTASACSPLAAMSKASGTTATKAPAVSTTKPRTTPVKTTPVKTTPVKPAPVDIATVYATRIAKPHAVTNAPALTSYPWAGDQSGQPDSYGLTRRQCVSYAAWYLNAHGTPFGYNTKGPKATAQFGNATDWDAAAIKAGFTVSKTPKVGAVAQWHSNEVSTWVSGNMYYTFQAGQVGHVGVVTKVYADGSVDVAQYNLGDARNFSVDHMKAPRYIVVPIAK